MPIEFRCSSCGKLLRTPDDSAGRQAKCPSCGQTVAVPTSAPPEPEQRDDANPFAETTPFARDEATPARQEPADPENPYATPAASLSPSQTAFPDDTGVRDGPPWERDGKSVRSFWETTKLTFGSTTIMFRTMRRQGGLGPPIMFGIVGGYIGAFATMAYQIMVMFAGGLLAEGMGAGAGPVGLMVGMLCGLIVIAVLIPISMILGMLIQTAIVHLVLMILQEGRFGFETTFRVVAYCTGATSLLLLIPFCGQYVSGIVNIVFVIIGLSAAQETRIAKAIAAVLLPVAFCLIIGVGGFLIMMALAFQNAQPF